MIGDVDSIDIGITNSHSILRRQHTFYDQLAAPALAQAIEEAPVHFSTTFVTHKFFTTTALKVIGEFRNTGQ